MARKSDGGKPSLGPEREFSSCLAANILTTVLTTMRVGIEHQAEQIRGNGTGSLAKKCFVRVFLTGRSFASNGFDVT